MEWCLPDFEHPAKRNRRTIPTPRPRQTRAREGVWGAGGSARDELQIREGSEPAGSGEESAGRPAGVRRERGCQMKADPSLPAIVTGEPGGAQSPEEDKGAM